MRPRASTVIHDVRGLVLGPGMRLFPDSGPDLALDVVEWRADARGVTIQTYRPAGRPQYSPSFTTDE